MRALLLRWAAHTSRHSKGSLKFNTKFHQLRRCNQLIYLVWICMDLRQIYYFVPKCWSEKDQLGTPKLLPPWVLSDQWLMRRMVILNHLMRWGNLWDNQLGQTKVLIPPFLHLLGKIGKVCVSKVYLFFPVHFALTRIVFPALASHHPLCVQARYLPVPILNAIAYSEPVVSKMAELWVVQFWCAEEFCPENPKSHMRELCRLPSQFVYLLMFVWNSPAHNPARNLFYRSCLGSVCHLSVGSQGPFSMKTELL